nr:MULTISPECIES: hypothetical protein [unclassified Bradyrhizobium]
MEDEIMQRQVMPVTLDGEFVIDRIRRLDMLDQMTLSFEMRTVNFGATL